MSKVDENSAWPKIPAPPQLIFYPLRLTFVNIYFYFLGQKFSLSSPLNLPGFFRVLSSPPFHPFPVPPLVLLRLVFIPMALDGASLAAVGLAITGQRPVAHPAPVAVNIGSDGSHGFGQP